MTERTTWEDTLWPVEPLLQGRTVFILASGPSLTPAVVERLRGQCVVVVNSTYKWAPWANVWYFTDNNVFDDNRAAVEAFPGHVVTMSRIAKREMPNKIKRVRGNWGPEFLSGADGFIRQGRSSGHTVISLVIAMGAATIVLLGYDMRYLQSDGGVIEHHHRDYVGRPRDLEIYDREFLPAFAGWNADALRRGVQIINCTQDSALMEFPQRSLDDVLRGCDLTAKAA